MAESLVQSDARCVSYLSHLERKPVASPTGRTRFAQSQDATAVFYR
jgi:hypothetical protein